VLLPDIDELSTHREEAMADPTGWVEKLKHVSWLCFLLALLQVPLGGPPSACRSFFILLTLCFH
jgi:hypothetical protein